MKVNDFFKKLGVILGDHFASEGIPTICHYMLTPKITPRKTSSISIKF
jgi:hypothetical protein